MKYITLLFTILFFSINGFSQSKVKYTVEGNIKGAEDTKAYLLKSNNDKIDTLGISEMHNGVFSFEGNLDAPTRAVVKLQNVRGFYAYIVLENAETTIKVDFKKGSVKIEGGDIQNILNKSVKIDENMEKTRNVLIKQVQEAQRDGDMYKGRSIANKIKSLPKKAANNKLALIEKYRANLAAAIILKDLSVMMNLKDLEKYYENLTGEVRNSSYGKLCFKALEKKRRIQVGKIAPNIVCNDIKGKELNMHNVKGKIKILDFWASWCRPCRMEGENLKKIYEKYKGQGLEIVSISLDKNKIKWLKAVQEDQMTWIHGNLEKSFKSDVAKDYCIQGIPCIFILDENNKIIATQLRGSELDKFVSVRMAK